MFGGLLKHFVVGNSEPFSLPADMEGTVTETCMIIMDR